MSQKCKLKQNKRQQSKKKKKKQQILFLKCEMKLICSLSSCWKTLWLNRRLKNVLCCSHPPSAQEAACVLLSCIVEKKLCFCEQRSENITFFSFTMKWPWGWPWRRFKSPLLKHEVEKGAFEKGKTIISKKEQWLKNNYQERNVKDMVLRLYCKKKKLLSGANIKKC